MQFFSCSLICQKINLDWYAAKIVRSIPLIDKEASTYWTLSDDEKVLDVVKYRGDIAEQFYVARDDESVTDWVVSELFMELCERNNLRIGFKEVQIEKYFDGITILTNQQGNISSEASA